MKQLLFGLVVASGILGGSLRAEEGGIPPLRTVEKVDLSRYVGKWHEIARFPNRFQEGCRDTTATYSLREDGKIRVVNECKKGTEIDRAEGVAEVVDTETWAKLRVNFVPEWIRWIGVGWGNYWIIDLGENYEYAVVSEPSREYLWILAREPRLSRATFDGILSRLKAQGFQDLSELISESKPGS
jgi:apolipoprotein D and lipocalin family protein